MQESSSKNSANSEYLLTMAALVIIVIVYVVNITPDTLFKVLGEYAPDKLTYEKELSDTYNENGAIILRGSLIDELFFTNNKMPEKQVNGENQENKESHALKPQKVNQENQPQKNSHKNLPPKKSNYTYYLIPKDNKGQEVIVLKESEIIFLDRLKLYSELLSLKFQRLEMFFIALSVFMLWGVCDGYYANSLRFIKGGIANPLYYKVMMFSVVIAIFCNVLVFGYISSLAYYELLQSITLSFFVASLWGFVYTKGKMFKKLEDK